MALSCLAFPLGLLLTTKVGRVNDSFTWEQKRGLFWERRLSNHMGIKSPNTCLLHVARSDDAAVQTTNPSWTAALGLVEFDIGE